MKTTILFSILCLGLISCDHQASDEEKLSKMKSPVIIVGIDEDADHVTVKDAEGTILISSYSPFANSLVGRKVNDTIK